MECRKYQLECLNNIKSSLNKGITRQLVSLPTGTGKTIIFSKIPETLNIKRMLVIAHREELLTQAKDKIERSNPNINVGIEQADKQCSLLIDDIVVASIATLGRNNSKRLTKFNPKHWEIIICDEAHHSIAPIYKNVFDYFGVFNSNTPLIGFTATPRRGDKVGLDSIYQDIVYQKDINEMIDSGWLCKIRGYRVKTNTDISKVKLLHGDFAEKELAETVNTKERNMLAVKSYKEYCLNRKALIFCVNRIHSYEMAETFNQNGIPCGVVVGDTPQEQRTQTLKDLAEGNIKAIANCMVLTEGFDLPSLSSIIMARPTKSSLLYTQCIGRGTRIDKDKDDVVIIDLTDNSRIHSIVGMATLFGLPPNYDLKGKSSTESLNYIDSLQKSHAGIDFSEATCYDDLKKIIENFDMLKQAHVDKIVSKFSKFIWTPNSEGYSMYLKDTLQKLTIKENLLGQYELLFIKDKDALILKSFKNIEDAFKSGDNYIQHNFPLDTILYSQDAHWRNDNASPKQIGMLKYLGVSFPTDITKGEASNLINIFKNAKGKSQR